MESHKSSSLQGIQPLVSLPRQTELAREKRQEQELRSRFELFNETLRSKSSRFSSSSFTGSSSIRYPAPILSSWLRDPSPPGTSDVDTDRRRESIYLAHPEVKDYRPGGHQRRLCGFERKRCWVLLAVITAAVLALAIGVGVGVGKSHQTTLPGTDAGSVSNSSTTRSSTTPTATTTQGSTTTTATSTSTTAVSTGGINCPAGNGTTYTVPGSTVQFLHLCGVDYSGSNESTNLTNVPVDSMSACMDNCAGTYECTGCGWGYEEGDSLYQHTCWMKTGLIKDHSVDPSWAFAVLIG